MNELIFNLHITPEQYQAYYQGSARTISVKTETGHSLKFPANAVQKFITHEGVHGRFKITFDENNKLVSVSRL